MDKEAITQEPMPQVGAPDAMPMLPAPQETGNAAGQAAARLEARPSCWQAGWRILVFMIKIGLVVFIIAAVIAAYYWGWPKVYKAYILPVQENAARVALLEKDLLASQKQLAALQTQLPVLSISQAGQAATLTALAPRVDTQESSLNALSTSQAGQAAALATLAPRIDALESSLKEQTRALAALQSAQTGLQSMDEIRRAEVDRRVAEVDRQITLLKSMELLSRARLFLYQSNFGLAKQDVQSARDLLNGALETAGQPVDKDLPEVVQHLDQVIERLPDFPVAASDELDAAWQILLGGPAQPTATPTPGAESTPTPAP